MGLPKAIHVFNSNACTAAAEFSPLSAAHTLATTTSTTIVYLVTLFKLPTNNRALVTGVLLAHGVAVNPKVAVAVNPKSG